MRNQSLYAPVSLKSAHPCHDLVQCFLLFLLKTEYQPHPTKKTLESNRVCGARPSHEINASRERSRRTRYYKNSNCVCMYVQVRTLCVARHAHALHVRVHSFRGKTQNLRSTKDATKATYSYNKRRRHIPVLVSSNTLGTEFCSHRCLIDALGGACCVRQQQQCDHVATAKQTQISLKIAPQKKK